MRSRSQRLFVTATILVGLLVHALPAAAQTCGVLELTGGGKKITKNVVVNITSLIVSEVDIQGDFEFTMQHGADEFDNGCPANSSCLTKFASNNGYERLIVGSVTDGDSDEQFKLKLRLYDPGANNFERTITEDVQTSPEAMLTEIPPLVAELLTGERPRTAADILAEAEAEEDTLALEMEDDLLGIADDDDAPDIDLGDDEDLGMVYDLDMSEAEIRAKQEEERARREAEERAAEEREREAWERDERDRRAREEEEREEDERRAREEREREDDERRARDRERDREREDAERREREREEEARRSYEDEEEEDEDVIVISDTDAIFIGDEDEDEDDYGYGRYDDEEEEEDDDYGYGRYDDEEEEEDDDYGYGSYEEEDDGGRYDDEEEDDYDYGRYEDEEDDRGYDDGGSDYDDEDDYHRSSDDDRDSYDDRDRYDPRDDYRGSGRRSGGRGTYTGDSDLAHVCLKASVGGSYYYQGFFSYGGDIGIHVHRNVLIDVQFKGWTAGVPTSAADQNKVATLIPLAIGASYKGMRGVVHPYVGGDAVFVLYYVDPNIGALFAPGFKVRGGADFKITETFGFFVGMNIGFAHAKRIRGIDRDYGETQLIIDGGAGIMIQL